MSKYLSKQTSAHNVEKVREHRVTGFYEHTLWRAFYRARRYSAFLFLSFVVCGIVHAQSLRLQRTISITTANQSVLTEFSPSAFSVSVNDVLYVSDRSQNRILKIDPSGQILEARGRFGWQPEEYDQPSDLVLAQNLNLFVADYNNSRLQQYDRHMNFIRTIPLEDKDSGVLYYPKSVDQAPSGWLYVLDAEQNQLLRLNPRGDVIQSIGTFAQMGKDLQQASRIRVHPNGDIWVFSVPGCIDIFDQFGTPKRTLRDSVIRAPVSAVFFEPDAILLNQAGTLVRYSAESGFHQLLLPVSLRKSQQAVDISRSGRSLFLLMENPVQIHQFLYNSDRED